MNFLKINLVLFFISTLISQSLMDLFSTLLAVGWVVFFFKEAKKRGEPFFHSIGLEKLWIPWILIVIAGFLWTPLSFSYALSRVVEFKWILQVYVFVEIFRRVKPSREVFSIFVGSLLGASLLNLAVYYLDWSIFDFLRYGEIGGGDHRAGGLFKNPMTFAHLFAIYVSLLLGLCLTHFRSWSLRVKFYAGLVLLLATYSLLLTFTRGVWIGFSIAALLGLFIYNFRWGIAGIVILAMLSFVGLREMSGIQDKVHQTRVEMDGKSERKYLWLTNWEIFKSSPVVGVGYGQNADLLKEYFEKLGFPAETLQSHAHNQYLHLLAGTGVLGLLCYLILWAFFIRMAWQIYSVCKKIPGEEWDQGMSLGSLIAMISFCIGSMTESNFEHSKVRFCIMLVWSYLIFLSTKYGVSVWKKTST